MFSLSNWSLDISAKDKDTPLFWFFQKISTRCDLQVFARLIGIHLDRLFFRSAFHFIWIITKTVSLIYYFTFSKIKRKTFCFRILLQIYYLFLCITSDCLYSQKLLDKIKLHFTLQIILYQLMEESSLFFYLSLAKPSRQTNLSNFEIQIIITILLLDQSIWHFSPLGIWYFSKYCANFVFIILYSTNL